MRFLPKMKAMAKPRHPRQLPSLVGPFPRTVPASVENNVLVEDVAVDAAVEGIVGKGRLYYRRQGPESSQLRPLYHYVKKSPPGGAACAVAARLRARGFSSRAGRQGQSTQSPTGLPS